MRRQVNRETRPISPPPPPAAAAAPPHRDCHSDSLLHGPLTRTSNDFAGALCWGRTADRPISPCGVTLPQGRDLESSAAPRCDSVQPARHRMESTGQSRSQSVGHACMRDSARMAWLSLQCLVADTISVLFLPFVEPVGSRVPATHPRELTSLRAPGGAEC